MMKLLRKACWLSMLTFFGFLSQSACAQEPNRYFAEEVSILELRINPERYSRKLVMVAGYSLETGSTDRLFLTKEHAMMIDVGNSIILEGLPLDVMNVSSESCAHRYVKVRGFVAKSKTYKSWVINNIGRIYEYDVNDISSKTTVCWSNE